MPKKTQYVVGFLFTTDGAKVVLIRKTHPNWQRNQLNGVGGVIQLGETPLEAMDREFKEEAGLNCIWEKFYVGEYRNHTIHFFRSFSDSDFLRASTQTKEEIEKHRTDIRLDTNSFVRGLDWLIPMALDKNEPGTKFKS